MKAKTVQIKFSLLKVLRFYLADVQLSPHLKSPRMAPLHYAMNSLGPRSRAFDRSQINDYSHFETEQELHQVERSHIFT